MPVLNDRRVARALDSVLSQKHDHDLEIVVVDGGSTDGTLDILGDYREHISTLISEPDDGIFDGVNKGILATSGTPDDIVHFLSADDRYTNPAVLRDVAAVFKSDSSLDACYGDQIYTNELGQTVRVWKAGRFRIPKLYYGWLPPHMTFFVRRRVYERYGLFDLRYPIAADFDFMLRLLHRHHVKVEYLQHVLVDMAPGGNSTKSVRNIVKASFEVSRACRDNGLRWSFLVPILKPARKILQLRPHMGPQQHGRGIKRAH